jgi:hypothetical protein
MKTLETQIREIITYHSDEGTSGYLLSEKQIADILSLIKSIVPDIPESDETRTGFTCADYKREYRLQIINKIEGRV